jgi:co-chaperonin GroES (HSP10)
MPRSASPKWAGRARRFKIENLKYPIMKESDIMGALVEAQERTKVA